MFYSRIIPPKTWGFTAIRSTRMADGSVSKHFFSTLLELAWVKN